MKEENNLRAWSEKIAEQDLKNFSAMTFGNKGILEKEIESMTQENILEHTRHRMVSKKEHGNLEGFYRTRRQAKIWILKQYHDVEQSLGEYDDESIENEALGVWKKTFYGLNNCKIFSPKDDLFRMLKLTDAKNEMLAKPPYPNTFISKIWNEDEITFWGVLMMTVEKESVYEADRWEAGELRPFVVDDSYMPEMPDRFFVAYVMGYDHEIGQGFTNEMYIPMRDGEDSREKIKVVHEDYLKEEGHQDKLDKYIDYALTVKKLFHYINTPNVEYVQRKDRHYMDKGNRRRRKKGKEPTQSHSIIDVDGTTKQYLDAIRERGDGFSSTHWVRGHFRVLRDKDYWGERAGDRIWVRPHVRGDGDLIEQEYEVK